METLISKILLKCIYYPNFEYFS